MNQLAAIDTGPTLGGWTKRQIATMRATVAPPEATDSEFQMFLEYAIAQRLDPFRGHIILVIYGATAKDRSKRKPTIIVTQAGSRVIAARCKDYRPASEPTEYTSDEARKGRTNPAGLVSCRVRLYKQDSRGEWYPVIGEAFWDERAPLRPDPSCFVWVDTGETHEDSGKPKKRRQLKPDVDLSKSMVLDESGNWAKMPRTMLEKCATMAALRAGWPEQFDKVYAEEEMDRTRVADVTAAELLEMEREDRRAQAVGVMANEHPYVTSDGTLLFVPAGKYGDRVLADARLCKTVKDIESLTIRNRDGFNRFWASNKDDALQVKREIENIAKTLPQAA